MSSTLKTTKLVGGGILVDLRGWMCPYPKFMLGPLLEKLPESGGPLVLLVDCPSAATDVPALARSKGYEVPEVRQVGGGEWQIVIRRKLQA